MIHLAIAALVFGIILFFLLMVGIESFLRSYGKTLTMLGLESALRSFAKTRINRSDSSYRNPEVLEHIRKINIIRYALHLGIVLSVSFVLFSRAFSSKEWVITVVILFLFLAILDVWWRRLIARG